MKRRFQTLLIPENLAKMEFEIYKNIFRFFCILSWMGNCAPSTKFRCNSPAQHAANQRSYRSRIVGGRLMNMIEGGYNVYIRGEPKFCSGSIIGEKWILTAAHCYIGSTLTVYVGSDVKFQGESFDVKNIHIHPQYKTTSSMHHYDYMLLELTQDMTYSQSVWAIPLAEYDTIKQGVIGTLSGFGYTSQNNAVPNYRLRSIKVPIIEHKKCLEYYPRDTISHDHVFCAGYEEGLESVCMGDSGGPFVVEGKLVGMTLGSRACGMPRTPTILTSIYFARPWICQIAGI